MKNLGPRHVDATPAGRRNAELAAIHAEKKKLGMDEDTYRLMLESVTGKRSAADLDSGERGRVLDWMRSGTSGFKTPLRAGKNVARGTSAGPTTQSDKINELWQRLEELGALQDSSDTALRAFVERQTKKSRIEWCTPAELNKVIEALKAWSARAARNHTGKVKP